MDCYRVSESAVFALFAPQGEQATTYRHSAFTMVFILSIWYNPKVPNHSGISEEGGMIAFDFGPKFSLGRVCITPNAVSQLPHDEVQKALQRHARGDWGEVDDGDCAENNRCIREGCRLLSAYQASNGVRFWIITEADRAATTVLLPEDY